MATRLPRKTRIPLPRVHPEVRRRTFTEVTRGYSEWQAVAEANRCVSCEDTPCAEGCPLEIDLKAFLGHVAEGDFDSAYRALGAQNALPASCCRVCRPEEHCEARCGIGSNREPVAIGQLERFVADWVATRKQKPHEDAPDADAVTRVAVIGAGPAGLAAAADLARLGHAVTVFEAHAEPGGMLRQRVPEFRLPKAVLLRDIERLQSLGVEIRTNTAIGRKLALEDLFTRFGYDAVLVAAGRGQPQQLELPGGALHGVYTAHEYLTMARLTSGAPPDGALPMRGRRVVVLGGGDTAVDVARTAVRLGAQHASLVYRRTRAEMRARAEDVDAAVEEGVQLLFLASPVECVGDAAGNVTGIRLQEMRLAARDGSGRRTPVPIGDAQFLLDADVVVFATGSRLHPLLRLDSVDPQTGATRKRGVFAGGHIVDADASVSAAMASGRRAARAIHTYLEGPLPDGWSA